MFLPFEWAQMVLRFVLEKAERNLMDKETREMFNLVIEAIDKSEERTNRRFDELEKRMKEDLHNMYENLHHEINGVKLHTEALDMRMEYVEKKVDSMDKRLSVVEEKVDTMDKRLSVVEEKVDSMNTTLQSMADHSPRIQALENRVFGKNKRTRRTLWQPLH